MLSGRSDPRGHSPWVAAHSKVRMPPPTEAAPPSWLHSDPDPGWDAEFSSCLPGGDSQSVASCSSSRSVINTFPYLAARTWRGKSFSEEKHRPSDAWEPLLSSPGKGLRAAKEVPTPAGTEMQERARNRRARPGHPDRQPATAPLPLCGVRAAGAVI